MKRSELEQMLVTIGGGGQTFKPFQGILQGL